MPALLVLPRELFWVTSNHDVKVLQIQRPTEGQGKKVSLWHLLAALSSNLYFELYVNRFERGGRHCSFPFELVF